jgi:hypothetical protein
MSNSDWRCVSAMTTNSFQALVKPDSVRIVFGEAVQGRPADLPISRHNAASRRRIAGNRTGKGLGEEVGYSKGFRWYLQDRLRVSERRANRERMTSNRALLR